MRTWGACCAVAVALVAPAALADTCPVPAGGSAKLAATDARERIDFLHRTADDQARYARTWKWAWFGIGWATFTTSAAQVVGWAAGDDKTREANIVDNLIVSGFSLVTPLASLIFALRVEKDAPAMGELLRQTGGGSAGTCLVLARIEELFEKDAAEEAFNTGLFSQVTALLGLAGMFGIMAIEAAVASDPDVRDAHWINAGTNTGAGLILTEAQILTSPTGAVRAYKRYLKGDLPRPKVAFSVAPMLAAPGITVGVTF
jgi:hypothetical protein